MSADDIVDVVGACLAIPWVMRRMLAFLKNEVVIAVLGVLVLAGLNWLGMRRFFIIPMIAVAMAGNWLRTLPEQRVAKLIERYGLYSGLALIVIKKAIEYLLK